MSAIFSAHGQENTNTPQRTPEQEAVKQTEKLQQELNLSTEQTKQVYEINLHYARERQTSNTRNQAIERMKNKNADVQRILSPEQNERLQTKRYERTNDAQMPANRNQPSIPSGFRAPNEYRANQTVRIPSSDMNMRSSFRQSGTPASSSQPTQQPPQTVRRSMPNTQQPASTTSAAPAFRSAQPQPNSPSSNSSGSSTNSTRRSEQTSSSNRR